MLGNYEKTAEWVRTKGRQLLLGQIVALLISVTGIVNTQLYEEYSVEAPCIMTALVYTLLFLVCTVPYLYRISRSETNLETLRNRVTTKESIRAIILYFILAVIDVQANWVIVKAYAYTTLLYAQVLDATIIPMAMVLSYFALKSRFIPFHYLGAILCLVGSTILCFTPKLAPCEKETLNTTEIISDTDDSSDDSSNMLLGNCLVILASLGYASSNVLQEYMVKTRPKTGIAEVRAAFGAFGPLVIGVQMFATREIWDEISYFENTENLAGAIGMVAVYGVVMVCLYFIMPILFQEASAVFVNLSSLTADIYAVVWGLLLFGKCISWLYAVGFVIIDCGIVAYNLRKVDVARDVGVDGFGSRLSTIIETKSTRSSTKDSLEISCLYTPSIRQT